MTPERWKQIEQLYHAALKLERGQRAAFLQDACAADEDLRQEVESLLARQPQAESFIEASSLGGTAQAMSEERGQSLVGRQLGAYKILSLLGAGGMGEVYKAQDTLLNRIVAIKVLPRHLSERADLRQRFEREARALASLSHPHICPIHVIGKEDGIDFLVMEYEAGKTLDELIPRKGLRSNEVLKYAIQIADALATAHAAGIVHRDLKPGNIMVSESGQVKVLDFGLAKFGGKAASQEPDTATLLASGKGPKTEEGTVLGTVSYMSPEQAEGKNLDARSDIFSFGLVLYEMVTGQKAFTGQSNLAILTAILREEPKPASQIVGDIPPDLEKLIKRCLRKDRERRFQHMGDIKVSLQELKEESDSGTLVQAPSPGRVRRRGRVWAVVAVVAMAVAGVVVWINHSTTKMPEAPLKAVPLTSYPGEERQASFSPDGNQVAFSWNGEKQDNFDIYIKDVGSGAQRRLTTALEGDYCPAWSPDGRTIAFLRGRPEGKASVLLISPLGPPERKVAEIEGYWFWLSVPLPWTPDAKSLVVSDRNSENEPWGLFLLSVESGERRRLTSGQAGQEKQFGDTAPALSPDGRTLAFVRLLNWGLSEIYLLALSEDFQPIGEPKRLTFENRLTRNPAWTSDGRELIFSSASGSSTFASPNLFRIAASGFGKPQRLAGVGEDGSEPAIAQHTQRLVYTSEFRDVNIWRVEVPGPQEKASSPMKLVSSTRFDGEAQFSPDGKKIAFVSTRTGNDEIWVCNSDGSSAQQLTSLLGTGICGDPQWSPDGERIAFTFNLNGDGKWANYVISANGGKPKRFLPRSPVNEGLASWSRDGKWIYFASERSGESQIWKALAEGGEAQQVTWKGGGLALESADGSWVYYLKNDEANSLWKVPKDGGEETQVLESVDKRAFAVVKEGIYFIPRPDSTGRYAIQFFSFATKKIRSITTIGSLQAYVYYLSVSPDGRWILYSQIDQLGSDLMLVENFR